MMDPSSQFIVPTIIDVPELIVTHEDLDFDDSNSHRGDVWFDKLQFLTSALSYAINLGNLWRFPYLCHKYSGGAFLVAYTIVLISIGMPLVLMELAFGQYANEGPINIWRISPAFEGIGYTMCLISAMVAIHFNMINSWTLHYLFASVTFSPLPWTSCDNVWNSPRCFLKSDNLTITLNNCTTSSLNETFGSRSNASILIVSRQAQAVDLSTVIPDNISVPIDTSNCSSFDKVLNSSDEVTLPANEYFHNHVTAISESIGQFDSFNWQMIFCLICVWVATFNVLLRNIRLSERLTAIGLIAPIIMLTSLFTKAISLGGAGIGVSHYLDTKWSLLQDIDIWSDATSQVFISLALCWGGLISLANMNKFHNNFHSNAVLIIGINYGTSIFSGMTAFAIIGYMSKYSGIDMDQVVDSGIGFIYMVHTEVIAKLPLAQVNSILFFGTILLIGMINQLTVIETVVTTIVDTWPHKLRYRKPLVLIILCGSMFLINCTMCFGNGFYLMQLTDAFVGTYAAMILGLVELLAIAWVYGMENFMQDIDDMISVHRNLFPSRAYWYFFWRYLTPSLLLAILLFSFIDSPAITYRNVQTPIGYSRFCWIVTLICVSIIPAIALLRLMLAPGGSFVDKIHFLCRPSEDWAPSSYVSGPKLLNRRLVDDSDLMDNSSIMYSSQRPIHSYSDQDQESNESNEDLKVVNGRANYIIPDEEDDTDTGLITNETNV